MLVLCHVELLLTTPSISFVFKEYDYVFEVDIEEGKPPLKLPFNVTGMVLSHDM